MSVKSRPPQNLLSRDDHADGPQALRVNDLIGRSGEMAILGFSCDAGVRRNQGRVGAALAPQAIRQSLANLAAPPTLRPIADLGDIEVTDDDLELGQRALSEQVQQALAEHERVVVFGGGHETAYGSFRALRLHDPGARIGIINIDAHLDIRNSSPVGGSSGTPFQQIRNDQPADFRYLCIGASKEANTEALWQRAADWRVDVVYDTELLTAPTAANHAIQRLLEQCDTLYLTIDIDALPHFQAPGVSAPAARGIPLHIVESVIDHIVDTCRRTGCKLPLADIVEVCPPLDRDSMTAKIAAYLALRLLNAELSSLAI